MLQNEIKSSFVELGNFLRQFSLEKNKRFHIEKQVHKTQ